MKRTKKITIWSISVITVLALLLFPSIYFVNFSLNHKYDIKTDSVESYRYMSEKYPWIVGWVDSLRTHHELHDTIITREDGVRLHGIFAYAPETTDKTAVIVHGYTDNSIRMLMIGYLYNKELGYNILLPDLYAHGKSEGQWVGMGLKDYPDVMLWMNIANKIFRGNNKETNMVVHGISMGAATTMMVSGHENNSFVKCFVEDCGYTSAKDEFAYKLKQMYHLPAFPYIYTASLLNKMVNGWYFSDANPLKAVSNCTKPMLFIHGESDTYVPTWMVYKLYDAKPMPKDLWTLPGVEHALSYHDYPKQYTHKVKDFVSNYIR